MGVAGPVVALDGRQRRLDLHLCAIDRDPVGHIARTVGRERTLLVEEVVEPVARHAAHGVQRQLAPDPLRRLGLHIGPERLGVAKGRRLRPARRRLACAHRAVEDHPQVRQPQPLQRLGLTLCPQRGIPVAKTRRCDAIKVGIQRRPARPIGVERKGLLQRVVGGPRPHAVVALAVVHRLGGDAEPLLVHVVLPRHEVVRVAPVRPRGILVVNVEPDLLARLPPAIRPLKDEAADGVAHAAVAMRVAVDVLPLLEQVAGLRNVVLAPLFGVEGVGTKLRVEQRLAGRLKDLAVDVAAALAAVDVGAEDIEGGADRLDDVEVLDVAVRQRDRVLPIKPMHQLRRLVHERVEVDRARVAPLHGQRLNLERGPAQPVVALVAQHPHQHAAVACVALHRGLQLIEQRLAMHRIRVVDVGGPDAVDGVAVAPHQVVHRGVDAVVVVDPLHPAGRDAVVLPDGVDPHRLQQRHVGRQRLLNEGVRLAPEVVGVVFADGLVVPVHAKNHHRLAGHHELHPLLVGHHLHRLCRCAPRNQKQRQRSHPRGPAPHGATSPATALAMMSR